MFSFSALLAASAAGSAHAQQIDMAAVQRWSNVKVAHYRIVGVFEGWTKDNGPLKARDRETGEINARDSVTLEFDWDVKK